MSNGTFAPIDTGGLTSFTEGAEAPGWYQLPVPGAVLPTLPGTTVPPGAQGFQITALADVVICFSPADALGGATTGLVLTAGSSYVFPGRSWVDGFCILLSGAGASFSLQYLRGSIGPLPAIPGGGGGTPPPPSGLTSLPTQNVVHVMKNGNDATGQRNRMDLPFLTITAAKAVLQPGDTMVIWPGTYAEGNINVPDVSYWLMGAIIVGPAGSSATFLFSAGDYMNITGTGIITHEAAPGTHSVFGSNNKGIMTVTAALITHAGGIAVRASGGCELRVRSEVQGAAGNAAVRGANITVWGNISNASGDGILCDGGITVYGDISASGSGVITATGTAQVYGDVSSNLVDCQGGRTFIHGNVTYTGSGGDIILNAKDCTVYGLVTGDGQVRNSSNLIIRGNIVQTGSSGTPALVQKNGLCLVDGDIIGTGSSGLPAIQHTGGILSISGRIAFDSVLTQAVIIGDNGSTLQLLGSCRVVSDTSDSIITGSTYTVNSYGAYATTGAGAGVTLKGTLTVAPWVS